MFYYLIVIFLTIYNSCVYSQIQDSTCIIEYNGSEGICKLLTDCPSVEKLIEYRIRPTICGNGYNAIPIVCCPKSNGSSTAQVNLNDLFDNTSNKPDIVYPPDLDTDEIPLHERKCMEYSKSISGEVNVIPLIQGVRPFSVETSKCEFNAAALIVGGRPALPGEFPFMAAIGFKTGHGSTLAFNCGGTLISERFVLTAAHCSQSRHGAPVKVRLGDLDLRRNDDGVTPVDVDIELILKHPNYVNQNKYNDIALIKLKQIVSFNKYIRPACLWNKNRQEHNVIATGWGKTDTDADPSEILLKVNLEVFDNKVCARAFPPNSNIPDGIVDTMLCAGDLKGERDTCSGDSGGPLFVTKKGNHCVAYVMGVTSFGKFCAVKNIPAVYTRVSSYINWIEKTVWN